MKTMNTYYLPANSVIHQLIKALILGEELAPSTLHYWSIHQSDDNDFLSQSQMFIFEN